MKQQAGCLDVLLLGFRILDLSHAFFTLPNLSLGFLIVWSDQALKDPALTCKYSIMFGITHLLTCADGGCSHEIKRRLLLGRKVVTNLESILESRDITLSTKVRLVKAMVFPLVMYRCESWTIKKAERRRIDAFELWCWRRLLRVPWTARRSNQSIRRPVLGVHWKDWCWSWNSSTLATWCEELTHLKRPWCWERLKVGGEGDDTVWDGWMVSPTQWTWVWVDSGSCWWTGRPGVLQFMGLQRVGNDWTSELNWPPDKCDPCQDFVCKTISLLSFTSFFYRFSLFVCSLLLSEQCVQAVVFLLK